MHFIFSGGFWAIICIKLTRGVALTPPSLANMDELPKQLIAELDALWRFAL